MDHDKAITTYAAERYVLGELSEADRDQFEEHFFCCSECSQDVRDLSRFSANMRTVLSEPEPVMERVSAPREKRSWFDAFRVWWPRPAYGLALLALLAATSVSSYQVVALRRQMEPQVVTSFVLFPDTRGEETVIAAEQVGPFLLLEADTPGGTGQLSWRIQESEGARRVIDGTAATPLSGKLLKLLVPASRLAPGDYTLTIRSEGGETVYRFRVASESPGSPVS